MSDVSLTVTSLSGLRCASSVDRYRGKRRPHLSVGQRSRCARDLDMRVLNCYPCSKTYQTVELTSRLRDLWQHVSCRTPSSAAHGLGAAGWVAAERL